MAETTPILPSPPRSTNEWFIPKVVRIEGDGIDPRNTKLFDGETGDQVKLPVHSLTFSVTADEPNSMEIVLAGVAIRAEVHHVRYLIDEEDLSRLAKQNGFEIVPVISYPTRIEPYGPVEHMYRHRDLPGYQFVQPGARPTLATLDAAGANLRQYLADLEYGGTPAAPPSELQEGEFALFAHKAPAAE